MKRKWHWTMSAIGVALMGCVAAPNEKMAEAWEDMLAEDYLGARDAYELILLDEPENPYAHLNLGLAYQKLDIYDAARSHYNLAIKHGEDAEVSQVVEDGKIVEASTTVADKGRQNLATLPQ